MIEIREERPEDIQGIRNVNELAFGQPMEADIVDRLRENCPDRLSLVALEAGRVVGHIFFSPVTIEVSGRVIEGMGLAPMAVLSDRQGQGIGSHLVRKGLEVLRERNCPFVVVLGHPSYYPRFGFEMASKYGIACQWENVPDEAFMVLILNWVAMEGARGVARYREEFDEAV
ncbi:MAG TPA: N-acetyltransferase [Synergistales bacterium]|jgi:putative acetyltransferase|nr:N-acetyltransferase [Synergistales bacterium]HRV71152.1 N-acetyltransferase [Thermovirgaceae bacterium]MDD3830595.1 N-acetyltransferase [Synergistales bacterium]HOP52120.1 N-acetyltransferase [Synergistales bacterium]HPD97012.1 N-acetyltransferase [Synergistales bacterium]